MPQRKAHRGCQPDMTKKRMAAPLGQCIALPHCEGFLPFPEQSRAQSYQLMSAKSEAGTGLIFRNRTSLDSARLRRMFLEAIPGWPTDGLSVLVRYSRGAD